MAKTPKKTVSLRIELPAEIHAKLKAAAAIAQMTLSDWVLKLLAGK